MVSVFAALLALALSASASPEDHGNLHQQQMNEHMNHINYILGFSCHPQPRSIPVHELLTPYQTHGKAYFPELTVLHRCDVFSGCCESTKKCRPLHADNVHLPFKVTYLEDMGDKHKGDWEMEYYYFNNHTVCVCDNHHMHKGHDQKHEINSQDHRIPEGHYEPAVHRDQNDHESHQAYLDVRSRHHQVSGDRVYQRPYRTDGSNPSF